jgi:hypothetical protein
MYFEVFLSLPALRSTKVLISQIDLQVVLETESLLLASANSEDIPNIPQTVAKYFEEKIELTRG